MINALLENRHHFTKPEIWDKPGLQKKQYLVIFMHTPANVDETDKLSFF
jgi:UDP-N-acetylglucosamine 2-epimerase (non-hydrolysing)